MFSPPTVERFRGDRVSFYAVLTQISITSWGDGHAAERIELGLLLKEPLESEATF